MKDKYGQAYFAINPVFHLQKVWQDPQSDRVNKRNDKHLPAWMSAQFFKTVNGVQEQVFDPDSRIVGLFGSPQYNSYSTGYFVTLAWKNFQGYWTWEAGCAQGATTQPSSGPASQGAGSPKRARTFQGESKVYSARLHSIANQSEYDKATADLLKTIEAARQKIEKMEGTAITVGSSRLNAPGNGAEWRRLQEAGYTAQANRRIAEAEAMFRAAAREADERFGSESQQLDESLSSLGSLLRSIDRYEESRRAYTRAVQIREHIRGREDETTCRGYRVLSELEKKTGNLAAAEVFAKRALDGDRSAVERDEPREDAVIDDFAAIGRLLCR